MASNPELYPLDYEPWGGIAEHAFEKQHYPNTAVDDINALINPMGFRVGSFSSSPDHSILYLYISSEVPQEVLDAIEQALEKHDPTPPPPVKTPLELLKEEAESSATVDELKNAVGKLIDHIMYR